MRQTRMKASERKDPTRVVSRCRLGMPILVVFVGGVLLTLVALVAIARTTGETRFERVQTCRTDCTPVETCFETKLGWRGRLLPPQKVGCPVNEQTGESR